MSSLDPLRTLPPLKSFALTHILYDPSHPLSIPLTLLSLSPIFLFVAYFTLLLWTRRLTILLLGLGSIGNEIANLALKRVWRADRPWKGHGEVGEGYGMPSSHSQAAGFLVGWGVGYAWTIQHRRAVGAAGHQAGHAGAGKGVGKGGRREVIRRIREGIWVLGLLAWSALVAYSRVQLHYHTPVQVLFGYFAGVLLGATYFCLTEAIPLYYPLSLPGRVRKGLAGIWEGVGGDSGWDLGTSPGGWGEGWIFLGEDAADKAKRK